MEKFRNLEVVSVSYLQLIIYHLLPVNYLFLENILYSLWGKRQTITMRKYFVFTIYYPIDIAYCKMVPEKSLPVVEFALLLSSSTHKQKPQGLTLFAPVGLVSCPGRFNEFMNH